MATTATMEKVLCAIMCPPCNLNVIFNPRGTLSELLSELILNQCAE